jgi:hypothetical protein
MDEHGEPDEAAGSGQDHLASAASDLGTSDYPGQELASRRGDLRSRQSDQGGLGFFGCRPSIGFSSSKVTHGTGFPGNGGLPGALSKGSC